MKSEEKIIQMMKKQGYRFVGNTSAVKICRWTKKALIDEGVCYKEKFYGIKSHRCCQMTPSVMWCDNRCLHCWRAIEYTFGNKIEGKLNSPSEIIEGCIKAQRELLQGFKIDKNSSKVQLSKANQKKYSEAQEPMQFAISLSGEPLIYASIGNLVEELRKRKKTSFIVTNGLHPEKILEMKNKNQLPTQLYVSVNVPREEMFQKFHRSCLKNGWEKLMETLEVFSKINNKTRTIFRMNLIKDLNMEEKMISDYVKLIKKANPLFVEIKGYMSVGFARKRLGYERMPTEKEMRLFCEKLVEMLGEDYVLLGEHEFSRAYLIGKKEDKKRMKIKKSEI
jgi:tRNA wybutosine-synthesizing protein 1